MRSSSFRRLAERKSRIARAARVPFRRTFQLQLHDFSGSPLLSSRFPSPRATLDRPTRRDRDDSPSGLREPAFAALPLMAFVFRGYGEHAFLAQQNFEAPSHVGPQVAAADPGLEYTVRLLQRWTLPTQMATASVCAATGDLIHQLALQDKRFDQVEVRSFSPLRNL